MKLLHSVPVANSALSFFLPKGQYGKIIIEYDLDAAAGVTITKAQLGNVKLAWNGEDVINIDAEALSGMNNLYGGVAKFAAAAGGATRCMIVIPCGMWWDRKHVYDVGANDDVNINLSFSAIAAAAVSDSGDVRVYGKLQTGQMDYLHRIVQRNVTFSGAGTLADTYPISNISQVYLKDPATLLVTQIQIQKDDETIVDAETDIVNEYSDFIHQVETTSTMVAIELAESGSIGEALGGQVSYKYTVSGATTVEQYFSFIDWVPDKTAESSLRAKNKMNLAANRARGR